MLLLNGDCIEQMQKLIDDGVQVDSVVTDPPYELGFMGKSWDASGIAFDKKTWELAFQLLKPGGYLLAFSASRNYHRMAIAVEDAGFEIRDQIMWIYGSGFPKNLNIGKGIDKKPNADLNEFSKALKERRIELGYSLSEADKLITGGTTMYSFLEGRKNDDVYPPNREYWKNIKKHFGMNGWEKIIENNLKVVGEKDGSYGYQKNGERWKNTTNETELTSETAKQYEGWGTALKPAHEPIVMARKPLEGTVVDNVLKHGTGGINIDGCRIETEENLNGGAYAKNGNRGSLEGDIRSGASEGMFQSEKTIGEDFVQPIGRFPANVMHDGSDVVVKGFPNAKGWSSQKHNTFNPYGGNALQSSETERDGFHKGYDDNGSAARFFYCPKTAKSERNQGLVEFDDKQYSHDGRKKSIENPYQRNKSISKNSHPTVKPVELMKYLCRLVTPKGGTVLDPFMGSGSTGMAAKDEGFNFIGIEREKEYFEISEQRIKTTAPLSEFFA